MNVKVWMFICSVFLSSELYAQVYFHVGGGLDYVTHDKSDNNYPMLNIKGGVGYKLSENIGFELDITGASKSKYEGTGTCNTQINTQITCTKSEEVSRQISVISVVYNRDIASSQYFIKGGLGFVRSAFNSVLSGDSVPDFVIADASDTSSVVVISGGFIKNDKHRFSGIASTGYGNTKTGDFGYLGLEYNYLINTKW
jgi:hypothetical protein